VRASQGEVAAASQQHTRTLSSSCCRGCRGCRGGRCPGGGISSWRAAAAQGSCWPQAGGHCCAAPTHLGGHHDRAQLDKRGGPGGGEAGGQLQPGEGGGGDLAVAPTFARHTAGLCQRSSTPCWRISQTRPTPSLPSPHANVCTLTHPQLTHAADLWAEERHVLEVGAQAEGGGGAPRAAHALQQPQRRQQHLLARCTAKGGQGKGLSGEGCGSRPGRRQTAGRAHAPWVG
jgi:hypothetical protein